MKDDLHVKNVCVYFVRFHVMGVAQRLIHVYWPSCSHEMEGY